MSQFNIEIDVAWWLEWAPIGPHDLVPEGTQVLQSASGHYIRQVVRDVPTTHQIIIRQEGLVEYIAGRVLAHKPASLITAILHHIHEAWEGHPPPEAWTDLRVECASDPESGKKVESQLRALYDLPKKAGAPPANLTDEALRLNGTEVEQGWGKPPVMPPVSRPIDAADWNAAVTAALAALAAKKTEAEALAAARSAMESEGGAP